MSSSSNNQAVEWTHVAEVTAPRNCHMTIGRGDVVGGVYVKPSLSWTISRYPCVGSICADKPRFSRRRMGAKVPTDIPGRKMDGTEAGDLNVREILAHAAPFLKDFFHRCSHRGRFRFEAKIRVYPRG